MALDKNLLIQGVNLMNSNGKIDDTVKADLVQEVNNIPYYKCLEIPYSSFNQTSSTGVVFDNQNRTATCTSTFSLVTNAIALTNVILFGIKLIATVKDSVTFQFSTNGVDFYNIEDIDIYINQTAASFYLKVTGASTVVKKLFVLYI